MTLTVSASFSDEHGSHEVALESDLAGLERSRHAFYGSDWAVGLGLRLLPLLKRQDLEVCGDDLAALAAEVDVLLRAIQDRDDAQYWTVRLGNIRTAVALAEAHGGSGCVTIS